MLGLEIRVAVSDGTAVGASLEDDWALSSE